MATQQSQTQRLQKQTQSSSKVLSSDERQKFVSDIVFFVLTQEQKKVPLKRSEIFRNVGLSSQSNECKEEIFRFQNDAMSRLDQTFGLTLKELPFEKYTYILINQVTPTESDTNHLFLSDTELAHRGLITALLGLVFMSGGVVKEDKILSFLTKLGLHGDNPSESSRESRYLLVPGGNVKQFIDKEIASKQKFLHVEKSKTGDSENPVLEYRWGSRAHAEVKKSEILKWVSTIYKCRPENFRDQYEEAKKDEPDAEFDDVDEKMDSED